MQGVNLLVNMHLFWVYTFVYVVPMYSLAGCISVDDAELE